MFRSEEGAKHRGANHPSAKQNRRESSRIRYTQQRDEHFKQLIDISVPFYVNYILYDSSDFSYRYNM